jgi:Kef-type K+ transport system membrane component KefB
VNPPPRPAVAWWPRGRWPRRLAGTVAALLAATVLVLVTPRLLSEPGHGTDPLARFLLAASAIVVVCHLLGAAASRLGQPAVVGEVLGGILLGPSVLGAVWPSGLATLFSTEVRSALGLAAQLGLVTFMFLLGCELRLGGLAETVDLPPREATVGPTTVAVVVTGSMGLTFAAGLAVMGLFGSGSIAGSVNRPAVTVLFFALALSITALPVLARILTDLGLIRTGLGGLALSCAAVGDVVLWLGLAGLLGAAGPSGPGAAAVTAAAVAAALTVTVLVVRPMLAVVVRRAGRRTDAAQILLPILLGGAIAYAAGAQVVGLHPVIGAFLFGVLVPRDVPVVEELNDRLRGFAMAVLLPLFFAGIGLATSIGLLGGDPTRWLFFVVVVAAASGAKFVGSSGAARLAGLSARDSLRLGALLNCRGVTEIVVAAIGWQYHIINDFGLTVLVLVALVTTATTGPLMNLLDGRSRWSRPQRRLPGLPRERLGLDEPLRPEGVELATEDAPVPGEVVQPHVRRNIRHAEEGEVRDHHVAYPEHR